MTKILIDYAPYLASIIAGIVAYLSFKESKRKTRHDELHDLYDEVKADNDRLRRENERLRKENNHEN